MRIEYELKFVDYLLFNAMHQLLSVPVQIAYLSVTALFFSISLGDQSLRASAITAVLAYTAMWLVQLLFIVFYLYFARNRSLLTRHIVEIQEHAFYDETRFNKSYHYWPGILKVVRRFGFIAVYTNAHAAHIVPSRAVATVEQRTQFLSAVKGKLNAA